MKSEFEIAITQLSADRNLSPEIILEAIEAALVSAYKRNYGSSENVSVTIDSHTGRAQVFVKKAVVEEVDDDRLQMSLSEARDYNPDVQVGDFVEIQVKPRNFGRIAAQTAKQVITQRIREAERESVYVEYADRVGEIVNGTVRNVDSRSRNVVVGLGKAEGILPRSEQIPGEHYRFGQRLRVYILKVDREGGGPQIVVSRAHRDLLRRLMELEVPEIYNGTVEVKSIAREPGFRSKVAVAALQAGVDPVGSCVGMRGVRVQNIVNELSGEKIDIVAWADDDRDFIANALSPARVTTVHLNEEERTAEVVVPDRVLSLAIGREGQNARLAAKLTGWRIDIRSEAEASELAAQRAKDMEARAEAERELEEARNKAADLLAEAQASLEDEELLEAGEAQEVAATDDEASLEEESADEELVDVESADVGAVDESVVEAPTVDASEAEVVDEEPGQADEETVPDEQPEADAAAQDEEEQEIVEGPDELPTEEDVAAESEEDVSERDWANDDDRAFEEALKRHQSNARKGEN